jgi:hypothetical protein
MATFNLLKNACGPTLRPAEGGLLRVYSPNYVVKTPTRQKLTSTSTVLTVFAVVGAAVLPALEEIDRRDDEVLIERR